jgi:hypothetical protein
MRSAVRHASGAWLTARTARDTRRLPTRLPQAKLRQTACSADLDYRHPRGFDQALIPRLATCQGGAGASQGREHRSNGARATQARRCAGP